MNYKQHWALFAVAHLYPFVVTSSKIREKVFANKKYKFSFLKLLVKCHEWAAHVITCFGQWPKGKDLAILLMPIIWVTAYQIVFGVAGIPWGTILGSLSGSIFLQVTGPLDHQRTST